MAGPAWQVVQPGPDRRGIGGEESIPDVGFGVEQPGGRCGDDCTGEAKGQAVGDEVPAAGTKIGFHNTISSVGPSHPPLPATRTRRINGRILNLSSLPVYEMLRGLQFVFC
jgi:hypothetical protein